MNPLLSSGNDWAKVLVPTYACHTCIRSADEDDVTTSLSKSLVGTYLASPRSSFCAFAATGGGRESQK